MRNSLNRVQLGSVLRASYWNSYTENVDGADCVAEEPVSIIVVNYSTSKTFFSCVTLAEWLRRVPAKYMGFPRESSNLSGDDFMPVRVGL